MPDELKQAMDAASRALKPGQVPLTRAQLAQFLKDEVKALENARKTKKEAEERKEAAVLLNSLVAESATATSEAEKASTEADSESGKFAAKRPDVVASPAPAPGTP